MYVANNKLVIVVCLLLLLLFFFLLIARTLDIFSLVWRWLIFLLFSSLWKTRPLVHSLFNAWMRIFLLRLFLLPFALVACRWTGAEREPSKKWHGNCVVASLLLLFHVEGSFLSWTLTNGADSSSSWSRTQLLGLLRLQGHGTTDDVLQQCAAMVANWNSLCPSLIEAEQSKAPHVLLLLCHCRRNGNQRRRRRRKRLQAVGTEREENCRFISTAAVHWCTLFFSRTANREPYSNNPVDYSDLPPCHYRPESIRRSAQLETSGELYGVRVCSFFLSFSLSRK